MGELFNCFSNPQGLGEAALKWEEYLHIIQNQGSQPQIWELLEKRGLLFQLEPFLRLLFLIGRKWLCFLYVFSGRNFEFVFVIVVSSRPSLFLCHFSWGEQLKVSSIQAGIARGSLFLYKRNEGLSASAKWNKIRQRIKVVVSFGGKRLVLKQISS